MSAISRLSDRSRAIRSKLFFSRRSTVTSSWPRPSDCWENLSSQPFPLSVSTATVRLTLPGGPVVFAKPTKIPYTKGVSDDEDGELVRKAVDGNDSAFAELAERYRNRAFGTASRFARGRAELEDLTQDIFLRAWKGLPSYRSDAPFEHWFMTIAVRTCYDFLRKNRKRRENEILVEQSPTELYADAADTRDQRLRQRRDAWEIVERLLSQLNEKERLIITLIELEEKTVKQTAALTGWSEANVKVRAHRARNKMRELFQSQQD